MLHIYTGEGKGKTTASVGLAVRSAGAGLRVLFVSFFKPDGSSEHKALERLGIDIKRYSYRGNFFKKYTQQELQDAKNAFNNFLLEIRDVKEDYDLIILDEIVYAIHMGLVGVNKMIDYLKLYEDKEVVMTGRDYPEELIKTADYVTEMKKIKHPFDKGAHPRKGIEY